MRCPQCDKQTHQVVLESRKGGGVVYRRRSCGHCGSRYSTKETLSDEGIPKELNNRPKRRAEHQGESQERPSATALETWQMLSSFNNATRS